MFTTTNANPSDENYNLREMTRSSAIALDGLIHFTGQLKGAPPNKATMEIVNTAISVHGKECPEVFFFGVNYIRDCTVRYKASPDAEAIVHWVTSPAVQYCTSALNFFKSAKLENPNTKDGSLVTIAFNLLYTLRVEVGPSISLPDQLVVTLSELLTTELMTDLPVDACAAVLSAISLLISINLNFLRKELIAFAHEYVVTFPENAHSVTEAHEALTDQESAFMQSVMYLTVSLGQRSRVQEFLVNRLFSKTGYIEIIQKEIASKISNRMFVFASIRCLALTLGYSLLLLEKAGDKPDEEDQSGGLLSYLQSSSVISVVKSRIPSFFDAIDINMLEELFTSYISQKNGGTDADSALILALIALAVSLAKRFGRSRSTRAANVVETVRKWALTATLSSNWLVAASGLSLIRYLCEATGSPVTSILSAESFRSCIRAMKSSSPDFSKQQAFALMYMCSNTGYLDIGESDIEILKVFIAEFNFHPEMMRADVLKKAYFRAISMKDALIRLLSEFRREDIAFEDVVVASRVLLQMLTAVKAKNSLIDFQNELVRMELQWSKKSTSKSSILVGFVRAFQLAIVNKDYATCEVVAHVVSDLFPKKPLNLVDTLLAGIENLATKSTIKSILTNSADSKYKPPSVSLTLDEEKVSLDCVTEFLSAGMVIALDEQVAAAQDTAKPEEPSKEPQEGGGWLDSAANWLIESADLDYVDDEDENKAPEKQSKQDESSESESEQRAPPPAPKDVPKVKAPVVKTAAVPPVKALAKPTGQVAARMAVKPAVAVKPATKPLSGKAPAAAAWPTAAAKGPPKHAAPVKAKAPPPAAIPPNAKALTPAYPVEEESKEKKKKKKKEDEMFGLEAYVPDTAALFTAVGGWFGSAEEQAQEKKKKKKESSEEERSPPSPPKKVPVKAATGGVGTLPKAAAGKPVEKLAAAPPAAAVKKPAIPVKK